MYGVRSSTIGTLVASTDSTDQFRPSSYWTRTPSATVAAFPRSTSEPVVGYGVVSVCLFGFDSSCSK